MKTLYIMQGAPGSGKSTIAKMIANGLPYEDPSVASATIVSADSFFCDAKGNYHFDRSKIKEAHESCRSKAFRLMDNGQSVIVDNTNIRAWECKPYVAYAIEKGYSVIFVRCSGQFENVHGVPDEIVSRMRDSMETLTVESVLASN